MTQRIATVLGGAGFIGRPVIEGLVRAGYTVRVASRRPDRVQKLRRLGGGARVVPVYASVTDRLTLATALAGAELAVNLVAILAETKEQSFAAINAEGAGRVARVAAEQGVSRYVHVSAIGADPNADSQYGRSKGQGELLVRQAVPHAAILRPSVVFGPEDSFLNMFARMAKFLPVLPVVSPEATFQPVYVGDVARAVVALAEAPEAGEHGGARTVEAGGPEVRTMRGLMEDILRWTGRDRRLLTIPAPVAWAEAAILEHLPGRLLTRDQLRMMRTPNVVAPDAATLHDLGITPARLDDIAPSYLG